MMRQIAILLFVIGWLGFATAQTEPRKGISPTFCEIARHPDRFAGKVVSVHARYTANWEWGSWLKDTGCEATINIRLPNTPLPKQVVLTKGLAPVPEQYRNLKVREDHDFREFLRLQDDMCYSTSDITCAEDSIEAEFTGIVVVLPRNDKAAGEPSSVLLVTEIGTPRLVRSEHPVLQHAPIAPQIPVN